MYAYVSSCFLECCPQMSFLYPVRRNYFAYNDDEFEKYKPRPKIVIDPEVASIESTGSACLIGPDDTELPQLRIVAQYSTQKSTIIVKVVKLQNFLKLDNEERCCIRMSLNCGKVMKRQTNFADGAEPHFGETFSFSNVDADSLTSASLRFRLYTRKGSARPTLRAEYILQTERLTPETSHYMLAMERIEPKKAEITSGLSPSMHRASNGTVNGDSRRSSMVDSCGRFCSQPNNDAPELLISLSYDPDHASVVVGIERGSQFGEKQKPPDTFIKIVASGEFGNEFNRQKTEMVKGSSEPQYDHSCNIELPRSELDTTTVRVEVWQSVGVLRRRHQLGWLAVGLNASSPDAQEHWEQMIQGQGISVSKWHPLQPPE